MLVIWLIFIYVFMIVIGVVWIWWQTLFNKMT